MDLHSAASQPQISESNMLPARRTRRILFWCVFAPLLCVLVDPGFIRPGWIFKQPFAIENFRLPSIQTCLAYALGIVAIFLSSVSTRKVWIKLSAILMYTSALFCGLISLILVPIGILGILVYGLGLLAFIPIMACREYIKEASRLLTISQTNSGEKWLMVFPIFVCIQLFVWMVPEMWIGQIVKSATEYYRIERSPPQEISYKVLKFLGRASPQILYSEAERRRSNPLYRNEFRNVFLDLTDELPPDPVNPDDPD